MAIVLNNINSGYNLAKINANFQNIEDYINDKLLARADTGVAGEAMMERALDMNGNEILNYPVDVTNPNSLVTKQYVDSADSNLQSQISNNINKSLRVPESYVPAIPAIGNRSGMLLGFNGAGNPIAVLPPNASASDVMIKLAGNDGLSYIGSAPTVSDLNTISPSLIGQRVQVTEYATGYVVGGGKFIVQSSSQFTADGGKVVSSASPSFVFVREEYYSSRTVKPEWYGCRGLGSSVPDTIPFKNMLSSLSTGDCIKLRNNATYYNSFPNNSQSIDGWVISATSITIEGSGSKLSRKTPSSASYSGFTTLKVTGSNFVLKGYVEITSEDPTNRPLYAYQSPTTIDSRAIFTSPLANTLSLWLNGVDGVFIGNEVVLSNAVFPFFANSGCKNMKVMCTAKKSGQIYPQPTSGSSDLALGSTFKLDGCSDFYFDVIAQDSAYAGIESESNNTNGSFKVVTNKAYHAGLHLWNNCSNINFDSSAADIKEGGGVIVGYGCQSCSGNVTAYNAQYACAFIGNSAATPVIGCSVKGTGYNVTDGVVFFTTAANNAYIQHCVVDVTVTHLDYFSVGTGRQSAVKFNGGQYCSVKVNSKDFDYIFSLGMGANNHFDVKYNTFNTAFSYSDQRSFDNDYIYTDPTGSVYHLFGKGSVFYRRSDAVTSTVLGTRVLDRMDINSTAFVNPSLSPTTGSVGGFYYDTTTKNVKINL